MTSAAGAPGSRVPRVHRVTPRAARKSTDQYVGRQPLAGARGRCQDRQGDRDPVLHRHHARRLHRRRGQLAGLAVQGRRSGEDAEQRWDAFLGDVARWRWARRRTSGCSSTRTCSRIRSGGGPSTATGPAGSSPTGSCPRSPASTSASSAATSRRCTPRWSPPPAGRNVWLVGGGDLVGWFHDAGLLDQVRGQHRAGHARRGRAAAAPPDRGAVPARGAPQRRLRRSRVRRRVPARGVPAGPGVRGSSAPTTRCH